MTTTISESTQKALNLLNVLSIEVGGHVRRYDPEIDDVLIMRRSDVTVTVELNTYRVMINWSGQGEQKLGDAIAFARLMTTITTYATAIQNMLERAA